MRASPGDRRIAEPVGYENLGQADGIADYDQSNSHAYGHHCHSHAHGHGHGHGHHGHAYTDAHDGDAYVNSDGDTNAEPCGRGYRR